MIIIDTKPYILRMVTDILYFYSFFLLTNYSKKNKINFVKWSLFIPITFLLQTVSELGNIVPIISGYWLLKEKNVSDNALLSNLIFSALVIYIENILSSTLLLLFFPIHGIKGYGYILVQIIIEFFLMILFYFFYLKLGVKKFFEENSSTSIVLLLSYLYTVSFLFAYIAHSYDIFDKFIYGIFIFFFIQTIFVLYLILQIMTKQKKKYEQHFIDQELKYLKKYTEQLEKNQEKLAKFRHDYKNLLLSLKGIASINDNFELLNQISHLEKYSVKNLDDIGFEYKFFTNIDNAYLKSLLISKFYQASKKNINCKFECSKLISEVPISTFDCIRILGIVLDNAIESAENSVEKNISMMIYKDNYQIEFFIKNSCTEGDIPMDKIMQKGISTKYDHSGFGLSTIHEINNNNSNMFVQYKKDQAEFTTQIILMCNRKE